MRNNRNRNGFSLIELLIVVAIILVIAAIAIPNLLQAKMRANETSAVGSMRTIGTAEVAYATTNPSIGYSADLPALGGVCTPPALATASQACLIDDVLAKATAFAPKSGYAFDVLGGKDSFVAHAIPATPGSSGSRWFFTNESGVIRYNNGQGATATDPAL